jgi:hypothetical protein
MVVPPQSSFVLLLLCSLFIIISGAAGLDFPVSIQNGCEVIKTSAATNVRDSTSASSFTNENRGLRANICGLFLHSTTEEQPFFGQKLVRTEEKRPQFRFAIEKHAAITARYSRCDYEPSLEPTRRATRSLASLIFVPGLTAIREGYQNGVPIAFTRLGKYRKEDKGQSAYARS